jgi:hypothetical protein
MIAAVRKGESDRQLALDGCRSAKELRHFLENHRLADLKQLPTERLHYIRQFISKPFSPARNRLLISATWD